MKRTEIKQGERYGTLTVVSEAQPKITPKGRSIRYVRCKCDCGVYVNVSLSNLRHSVNPIRTCRACGAKHVATLNTKHGGNKTRLYIIYKSMLRRCRYKEKFPRYAGRGIGICKEWADSFSAFREWALSHGYSDSLSIDRINNNDGYYPKNCRWVTQKEQMNNVSTNFIIGANNKTQTLAQWAEETGINASTIRARILRGWNPEKAINMKPKQNRKRQSFQSLFGSQIGKEGER